MKTKTFKQIIDRMIEKGVDSIKITRSTSFCGCIEPNDIISIEIIKDGNIYVASATHVFDEPKIDIDKLVRDESGRCIARWTIGQFNYAI